MAGPAADRELSRAVAVPPRGDLREARTTFRVATISDDVAIRQLLRETPMQGAIRITFEREPDCFRGADVAGGEERTIVAYEMERLVCMGRCIRRDAWLNGAVRSVGYLGELRLDESARGRFGILRDGYRFFHALERETRADLYFTSIAADNERARRLLERGARGLPAYTGLSELDTLLVSIPRGARKAKLCVENATPERIPDMLRVLNAPLHQLAAVWTADRLRALERHGLPLDRFLLVRDGNDIVACGALWDQRSFRQTVIRGYSRPFAVVRPFVNLARRAFGTPHLPRVGSALAHVFLSPLGFVDGAEGMLSDFVEAAVPFAARCGAEFLTLALPATDPRLAGLRRRFSTRTWRSRLYRVDWRGERKFQFAGNGAPFLPDVALL